MTLTAEQLEQRRHGIGGSDVAAIAGLAPKRTAWAVWLEKTGVVEPFEGNRFTHAGNLLEEAIAQAYFEAVRTEDPLLAGGGWPRLSLRISKTLAHPQRPWQLGTPDRLVYGSPWARRPLWGVEIKNRDGSQRELWGEPGSDQVPDDVAIQCQWYMSLTGLARWDVEVLLGGNDFRRYQLTAHEATQAGLLAIAERFYTQHVVTNTPPELDGSEAAAAYLAQLHPKERRPLAIAPEEAERWVRRLARAKRLVTVGEAAKAEAENHLKELVADAEGIAGAWGRVTWKLDRTGRTDWKQLALDLGASPEQIATHRAAPQRRFLFHPVKEAA